MGVNKVILHGETLIDLTGDSVTPELMALGASAHGADGEAIAGTLPRITAGVTTLDSSTKSYTIPAGIHDGTGTVRVKTQTKSVTPTASSQTVKPDSGYLLSSVSVGAAKLYATGTVTLTANTTQMNVGTGVTLKSTDIFILLPDYTNTAGTRVVANGVYVGAVVATGTDFRMFCVNSGLCAYKYDYMSVTYSAQTVILRADEWFFGKDTTWRWVLLR